MKLLTFIKQGKPALGVKTDAGIVDIAAAAAALPGYEEVRHNMMQVISGGRQELAQLERLVADSLVQKPQGVLLTESEIEFGPCVPDPGKIICVGLNYRKHAEETNAPIPQYPVLFNKFKNTITAHQADIEIPAVTQKLDYEVELVIVMGKQAKNVARSAALDTVFGYCCVNDLSARDLQLRTSQWLLGKSCDNFSPLGPYLVTADEVGDPNRLEIKSIVNGDVRQHSNTSDMIFPCDEIVSYISRHMTLEPGDIILTGTPEGVVLGYPPEKQVYLQDGDVVTIEIEKLGSLTNRFVNP